MIGLKCPRHPDDAGNIALPWARFVPVSRKIAHIVNFFPVIRQEYNDGVFSLEPPKDRIDNGIIIEYGVIVCRAHSAFFFPGGQTPTAFILRGKLRIGGGITPLEILMRPHEVQYEKMRLRIAFFRQRLIQQRQKLFIISLGQINRMGQTARKFHRIAAPAKRPPNAPIETGRLLIRQPGRTHPRMPQDIEKIPVFIPHAF